ncbi:Sodium/hydrogen exchanger family-domain-containing protein [Hypoxylon cercidicola]|nr:Sodium/hydrogen exchanger family-domain-containing protein [Hypoxylon cercidicola]
MAKLENLHFNIVLSLLGGWLSIFGLDSYLVKEKLFISESFDPIEYTGSRVNLTGVTLNFTRLVLGIQLMIAGIQLPHRYLAREWRSLVLLLGPVMTLMWATTGLLVYLTIPRLPLLHALVIGACVAPTDPVLSSVVAKGRFADLNIRKDLQRIIVAESGPNDGLGYPFLFFALYLIKYVGDGGQADTIPFSHLIMLGVLILLLRRLPYIFAFQSLLPQIENKKEAAFMGFFGPIGCSAMFCLYITMDFVNSLNPNGGKNPREDVKFLREDVRVVVWFLMTCSVASNLFSISSSPPQNPILTSKKVVHGRSPEQQPLLI